MEDDFNQANRGDDIKARYPSIRVLPSTEEERMQSIWVLELQKQEYEEEQRYLRLDVIRYSPLRGSPRRGRSPPYRCNNNIDGNKMMEVGIITTMIKVVVRTIISREVEPLPTTAPTMVVATTT